jgi:hypothetical protein
MLVIGATVVATCSRPSLAPGSSPQPADTTAATVATPASSQRSGLMLPT